MPPKVNPLGGSTAKSPLGGLSGPLSGPLSGSQKLGLLSTGPALLMPAINKEPAKNTGKKSLLNDD